MQLSRRLWIRLGLAALYASAGAARAQKTYKTYSFGVVPQESASQLAESWTPVLNALAEKSGLAIAFGTAPDVPTFEKRVAAGEYDFAYMNPYHFTVFNAKPGYHALARAKDERLRGIVVVRKDSPYKELRDLSGASFAFPTPAAFAATLLIEADLRKRGIAFEPKIVKSHNSVYRDVARGLYPAGGGVPRTFRLLDDSVARDLRILYTSADFTAHAIASRPGMDAAIRDRLLKAMLAMSQDAKGLQLLQRIGFSGFEPALDRDWDDVRALRIRPADSQIQE
jgi:phosphonate transport system substrate-binding protein